MAPMLQSITITVNGDGIVQQEETPYDTHPLSSKFVLAAMTGNWSAAEEIILQDINVVRAPINTSTRETVVHVLSGAAQKKHKYFLIKLLERMNTRDLEITNSNGITALHFAASSGNLEIARLLVEKNSRLPSIANAARVTPLYMAVLFGHSDMADYLFPLSECDLLQDATYGCKILNTCISTGLYGIALQMVERCPFLAKSKDENNEGPLVVLARNPSPLMAEDQIRVWYKTIYTSFWKKVTRNEYSPTSNVYQLLIDRIWSVADGQEDILGLLFAAANAGNFEFLVHLLRRYPDILYKVNDSNHTIFHIAVLNRNKSIFNLIYEIGELKRLIATYRQDDETNLLHLVARLAPSSQLECIPGAALQMQREILWYKEVEKIVPLSYKDLKNGEEKTPHDVFQEEHTPLKRGGEKWMKGTAQAGMVVATLIAIVVYTTAFTIHAGAYNNNGQSHMPILEEGKYYKIFMISEIIAMISSSTSIIMFLCIFTSRYAEHDFLYSLPFWLLTGIIALIVSLAAMLIASCTTLLVCDKHGLANFPTLLGFIALVPLMFLWVKYPLLVDIFNSAYGSTYLFRSCGRLFDT